MTDGQILAIAFLIAAAIFVAIGIILRSKIKKLISLLDEEQIKKAEHIIHEQNKRAKIAVIIALVFTTVAVVLSVL